MHITQKKISNDKFQTSYDYRDSESTVTSVVTVTYFFNMQKKFTGEYLDAHPMTFYNVMNYTFI